jgi:hypothetical protein
MKWKSFFMLLFCFILIDYVVISYNYNMWQKFVERVQTVSTGASSLYNKIIYSLIAWFILVLGLYIFVVDKVKSLADCVIWGTLYAFVVYGVFNFTNMAIMENVYTPEMASRDILSGIITTVLALLAYYSLTVAT